MLDASRVQKELVEFERDKSLSGVSIQIYGDDLTRMRGTISGPVGTPYEGGIFTVDIQLPSAYPFEPPKMQFITKVWYVLRKIYMLISMVSFPAIYSLFIIVLILVDTIHLSLLACCNQYLRG
jgi:hypothetical protein